MLVSVDYTDAKFRSSPLAISSNLETKVFRSVTTGCFEFIPKFLTSESCDISLEGLRSAPSGFYSAFRSRRPRGLNPRPTLQPPIRDSTNSANAIHTGCQESDRIDHKGYPSSIEPTYKYGSPFQRVNTCPSGFRGRP